MDNDNAQMEEWMYDFAWRSRDITQKANDRIDSKALNLIYVAGILISIMAGYIFFSIDNILLLKGIYSLFLAIVLLNLSVIFAFLAVRPRNQGGIEINKHFDNCPEELHKIYGLTARTIGNWQEQIKKMGIIKNNWYLRASVVFIISLLMIIHSIYLILFV